MENIWEIEIPTPTYGYLRGSKATHERMDASLYNGWIQQDLDKLIYVDRLGGNRSGRAFMCQVGGFSFRYRTKYTRGVIERGEERGKLAELQIDKVAAQREVTKKQLEGEDIPDGLRVEIKSELASIRKRWEPPRDEDAKQGKGRF